MLNIKFLWNPEIKKKKSRFYQNLEIPLPLVGKVVAASCWAWAEEAFHVRAGAGRRRWDGGMDPGQAGPQPEAAADDGCRRSAAGRLPKISF